MLTPEEVGQIVRVTRKQQGLTLAELAMTCGTGQRFIVDLEKGKPTCRLELVLRVLQGLGIELVLNTPDSAGEIR